MSELTDAEQYFRRLAKIWTEHGARSDARALVCLMAEYDRMRAELAKLKVWLRGAEGKRDMAGRVDDPAKIAERIQRLRTWGAESEQQPEGEWLAHMRPLLGEQVTVTIEWEPKVVAVTGTLLSFDEAGGCVVRDEMGFAHWYWPNLDTSLVDTEERAR